MKYHWIWDRTERSFSKGQRLLDKGHLEEALRWLDNASTQDPEYSGIHLWRGLTLSEMGQYEQALAALRRAQEGEPLNSAFVMYEGVICLDHGHADEAVAVLDRASTMDRNNAAISGYRLLAEWDLGKPGALTELIARVRQMPDGVKSRFMVRLEAQPQQPSSASSALGEEKQLRTPRGSSRMLHWIRSITKHLSLLLARRQFDRVGRLIRERKFEGALRALQRLVEAGHAGWPDFSVHQTKALEGGRQAIEDQLRNLEKTTNRSARKENIGRRVGRTEAKRRRLLAQLAWFHAEMAKTDETYNALRDWRSSYDAAGRPDSERHTAGDVTTQLAEIDLHRGKLPKALRWCDEARAFGSPAELDLIEAKVHLALGHRLAARRCFERHIEKNRGFVERRLVAAASGA
jgi:tetratricopeptide (TPR) repeat protein